MHKTMMLVLALAYGTAQAQVPDPKAPHDGRWLRTGIQFYEKLQAGLRDTNAPLTHVDSDNAIMFTSYYRGTLDIELLHAATGDAWIAGATEAGRLKRIPSDEAKGVKMGINMMSPLVNTGILERNYEFDQYVQILKNYLEKHPEMWNQSAPNVIEFALRDAFPENKPK